jgi:hypothetical protein
VTIRASLYTNPTKEGRENGELLSVGEQGGREREQEGRDKRFATKEAFRCHGEEYNYAIGTALLTRAR